MKNLSRHAANLDSRIERVESRPGEGPSATGPADIP